MLRMPTRLSRNGVQRAEIADARIALDTNFFVWLTWTTTVHAWAGGMVIGGL